MPMITIQILAFKRTSHIRPCRRLSSQVVAWKVAILWAGMAHLILDLMITLKTRRRGQESQKLSDWVRLYSVEQETHKASTQWLSSLIQSNLRELCSQKPRAQVGSRIRGALRSITMERRYQQTILHRRSMEPLLSMDLWTSRDSSSTPFIQGGSSLEVSTSSGIVHQMTNSKRVTSLFHWHKSNKPEWELLHASWLQKMKRQASLGRLSSKTMKESTGSLRTRLPTW